MSKTLIATALLLTSCAPYQFDPPDSGHFGGGPGSPYNTSPSYISPSYATNTCDSTCRQGLVALISSGMLYPPQVHPYVLPSPQTMTEYRPSITCSTIGSNLTGIITCN